MLPIHFYNVIVVPVVNFGIRWLARVSPSAADPSPHVAKTPRNAHRRHP